ncbi:hypothetical protein [Streptomyces sp. FH025]|uniref:hypothetical protein n=1 Tax=Streptomyces sp. FH025 TaxID=2815937 RepID=UPI001A9DA01D|nr:hypothetical protein [Streptomyces sp. FH025]MBO1415562.1 hypothetical protein [Streptomyces sp. FH025]
MGNEDRRHPPLPAPTGPGPGPVDLAARVDAFTADFFPSGHYTPPDQAQRRAVADGVLGVLDGRTGEAERALARVGYRIAEFAEAVTGRRVAEIAAAADDTGGDATDATDGGTGDGRGWGRIYLDLSERPTWSVQVPHPASDLRTEALGVELFRAVPGGVLVLAGAHRRAGADGRADVAHRRDTAFAAVVEALTGRGLPGLQVHGFGAASLPGWDAVVSSGAGRPGPAAELTAEGLGRAGLAVRRAWREPGVRLTGATNVAGRFAAGLGVPWLHVELVYGVRADPARRAAVAGVLAETVRSWEAGQQGRRRRSST